MSKSFDEWYKDQKEFQKEWAEQELGIVRCKDCKYFMDGNGCHLLGVDYTWEEQMTADDFCSRGERKCGLD